MTKREVLERLEELRGLLEELRVAAVESRMPYAVSSMMLLMGDDMGEVIEDIRYNLEIEEVVRADDNGH